MNYSVNGIKNNSINKFGSVAPANASKPINNENKNKQKNKSDKLLYSALGGLAVIAMAGISYKVLHKAPKNNTNNILTDITKHEFLPASKYIEILKNSIKKQDMYNFERTFNYQKLSEYSLTNFFKNEDEKLLVKYFNAAKEAKIQNIPLPNAIAFKNVDSNKAAVSKVFASVLDSTFVKTKYTKGHIGEFIESLNEFSHNQIRDIERNNENIAQISEEYKIINTAIDIALKKDKPEMAIKVGQWIEDMDKLAKENKGFKKVYGYQGIKNFLKNKFVFGDMMMDKVTGGNGNVPNALLVYGPPNNGKTLFARALAEQSLSNLEEISLAKLFVDALQKRTSPERLAMDNIRELAQNSLLNYKNNSGQRTIILVNEAEGLADSSSPIFNEFRDFIKTCSDKYKCTLFLTTNNPTTFDKNILSQIPKDYKIGLAPASKETCKEIFYKILNPIKKMPSEGTDTLVESFFKNPNKFYSNASIIDIIKNTLEEFNGRTPTIRDYQEIIKRNFITPIITKEDLEQFYKNKKVLEG